MTNHPNRKRNAETPTPDEVREFRRTRELSAAQAAALVHVTANAWQKWEAGDRPMHPAFWELARMKHRPPPTKCDYSGGRDPACKYREAFNGYCRVCGDTGVVKG